MKKVTYLTESAKKFSREEAIAEAKRWYNTKYSKQVKSENSKVTFIFYMFICK